MSFVSLKDTVGEIVCDGEYESSSLKDVLGDDEFVMLSDLEISFDADLVGEAREDVALLVPVIELDRVTEAVFEVDDDCVLVELSSTEVDVDLVGSAEVDNVTELDSDGVSDGVMVASCVKVELSVMDGETDAVLVGESSVDEDGVIVTLRDKLS